MRLFNKVCRMMFISLFVLAFQWSLGWPQEVETGNLTVKITDLKSNEGEVLLALYNSKEEYENADEEGLQQCIYRSDVVPITENQASTTFHNLPFGDYVLIAIHDKNSNHQLDRNFIGVPQEGFGFSNNPGLIVDKPDWEDIQFEVKSGDTQIIITMKYF